MKTILVTGASGGVGSTLTPILSGLPGYRILTVGRAVTNDIQVNLANDRVFLLKNALEVDVCIHLAAAVPRMPGQEDSRLLAETTRAIDATVFEACKKWECISFYVSGCSLYEQCGQYISEAGDFCKTFASPYLEAKAEGDRLFSALEKGSILRISAPVTKDLQCGGILQKFANQLSETGSVTVWGTGLREQDFIDVRDIARLIRRILDSNLYGIYNVAQGTPTTMYDLAVEMASLVNGEVKMSGTGDKEEDKKTRYAIGKANRDLNWKPKFSLRESLKYHWCEHE